MSEAIPGSAISELTEESLHALLQRVYEQTQGNPLYDPNAMADLVAGRALLDAERARTAAAVAAEREWCAKVADGAHAVTKCVDDWNNGWSAAALQIAQAIRMRGGPNHPEDGV
jgi:hypothetical protein